MLSGMAEFKSPSDSIRHLSVSWLLELASSSRPHIVVSQDLVRKINHSRCLRGSKYRDRRKGGGLPGPGSWSHLEGIDSWWDLLRDDQNLLLKTSAEVGFGERKINTLACPLLPEPVFCWCCPLAKHNDKPLSTGGSDM